MGGRAACLQQATVFHRIPDHPRRSHHLRQDAGAPSLLQPSHTTLPLPHQSKHSFPHPSSHHSPSPPTHSPTPHTPQELEARKRERERRAALEAKSHSSARHYDILSNLDRREQATQSLGDLHPHLRSSSPSPYASSYRSPSPYTTGAPLLSSRTRTTTNHTHYSYDIISGRDLPPDHDSLAPSIRRGAEAPIDVREGNRTAKKHVAVESSAERRFDILSGRARSYLPDYGPNASAFPHNSVKSPAGVSPTQSPDRGGKRQYNVRPAYNVINGQDY